MYSELDMVLRLLLASVLGGVVGLEREIHGRPAGFRTHLLVALGSCLFVITSIHFYYTFGNFKGVGAIGVDPARIAAQVVTGIGFLGAGAIIREKASIRGLTTAACLWVAAAIGVACGAGRYAPAILVTIIAFSSLLLLKKVEMRLRRDRYLALSIWSDDLEGQVARVRQAIESCNVELMKMAVEKDMEKRSIRLDFQARYNTLELACDLAETVACIEGVKRVRID